MILSDGKELFNTLFKLVPVNSVNLGHVQNTWPLAVTWELLLPIFDEIERTEMSENVSNEGNQMKLWYNNK